MKKIILLLERFGRIKEHTYEEKKSDFMSRTNKNHKVTVKEMCIRDSHQRGFTDGKQSGNGL